MPGLFTISFALIDFSSGIFTLGAVYKMSERCPVTLELLITGACEQAVGAETIWWFGCDGGKAFLFSGFFPEGMKGVFFIDRSD